MSTSCDFSVQILQYFKRCWFRQILPAAKPPTCLYDILSVICCGLRRCGVTRLIYQTFDLTDNAPYVGSASSPWQAGDRLNLDRNHARGLVFRDWVFTLRRSIAPLVRRLTFAPFSHPDSRDFCPSLRFPVDSVSFTVESEVCHLFFLLPFMPKARIRFSGALVLVVISSCFRDYDALRSFFFCYFCLEMTAREADGNVIVCTKVSFPLFMLIREMQDLLLAKICFLWGLLISLATQRWRVGLPIRSRGKKEWFYTG